MEVKIPKEEKELELQELIMHLDEGFIRSKRSGLYKYLLEALEKPLIERVLEKTDGNQFKASRILGINRNTLRSKIKKLGINVEKWKIV